MKDKEKQIAIQLRKQGKTYTEILKEIHVSKSSLSLWLRAYGLSKKQKQRMTEKKLAAIKRGHEKWRQMRIDRKNKIINEAINQTKKININKEKLFLMGLMLYWAEGAKEKEYKPGQSIYFSNSDPKMIVIFIKWLIDCINIERSRIKTDIYLHENNKHRINEVKRYWSKVTGFSITLFDKIYFKKHIIKTKRKNIGNNYYGLLRVKVTKSSDLNRKIDGWIQGITNE